MTVVGDPDGMRALADQLSSAAGRLRETGHDVKHAMSKADASGEWFDDCEIVVKANATGFSTAADELDALVKLLRRSATEVEQEKAAEARHLAELERQRHEAAMRASQQGGS